MHRVKSAIKNKSIDCNWPFQPAAKHYKTSFTAVVVAQAISCSSTCASGRPCVIITEQTLGNGSSHLASVLHLCDNSSIANKTAIFRDPATVREFLAAFPAK